MAHLHNSFEIFEASIQNYPSVPNLMVIGSEMTEIGGEEPPLSCVYKIFDPIWNRVKSIVDAPASFISSQ